MAAWVGGTPSAGTPYNSQQLGMAGLDKAMFKGSTLSVPSTCLISLLPWAGPVSRQGPGWKRVKGQLGLAELQGRQSGAESAGRAPGKGRGGVHGRAM